MLINVIIANLINFTSQIVGGNMFVPASLSPAECGAEEESTTEPPVHSTPEVGSDIPH